ncbi:MAG: SPOR domain-containing protein [Deltaproteobacteria bacterium]|nr:SPOR domain-containing protein [Deltaproteobacteria bacterium]
MTREPEYKDKIEVSLDGRQIFYLFFGGAVIVGLVFVVGVMVGRRVEARGHTDRAQTSASADPLAALDQLEASRPPLGFKSALSGTAAPTEVDRKIEALEKTRAQRPEAAMPPLDEKKAKKSDKKSDKKGGDKSDKSDKSAEKSEKSEKAEKSDKKKLIEKPSDLADGGDKQIDKQTDKSEKSERSEKAEKSEKSEKSAEADKPASRFTLQLSSFQDRNEAEAFLATMKSAGYTPYVTETQIAGKGTFYRVRMGSYRSMQLANDAKAELERSGKTASVMRL